MTFHRQLQIGKTGESLIAQWLRKRGHTVLPVYEKIIDEGKGPQLFLPDGCLVAPDMLVYKGGNALWIEAKHKTAFSWHRKTGQWVTGIDLRHYRDYISVDDQSPWPVWLLFLHQGGQAKDSPPDDSPGLFGNTLSALRACENHRHDGWGNSGMVYWSRESLKLLAPIDEFVTISYSESNTFEGIEHRERGR